MIYKQNTRVFSVLMLYLRKHFCLQYFFKKTLLFGKKTPLCFLGNDCDVVKNNTLTERCFIILRIQFQILFVLACFFWLQCTIILSYQITELLYKDERYCLTPPGPTGRVSISMIVTYPQIRSSV